MQVDKNKLSAHALQMQSARSDLFGMRSYQYVVPDVTVYSPSRNLEEMLLDAVKKLRAYEKQIARPERESSNI